MLYNTMVMKVTYACHRCPFVPSHPRGMTELGRHLKDEHGTDEAECPLCKRFVKPQCLWSHETHVHMKKKWKCNTCNFKGATESNLKAHNAALKCGGQPVNCPLCDKPVGEMALQTHVNRAHIVNGPGATVSCHVCGKNMKASSLKGHADRQHGQAQRMKCGQCDFSTLYAGALRGHVRSIHEKRTKHQ